MLAQTLRLDFVCGRTPCLKSGVAFHKLIVGSKLIGRDHEQCCSKIVTRTPCADRLPSGWGSQYSYRSRICIRSGPATLWKQTADSVLPERASDDRHAQRWASSSQLKRVYTNRTTAESDRDLQLTTQRYLHAWASAVTVTAVLCVLWQLAACPAQTAFTERKPV